MKNFTKRTAADPSLEKTERGGMIFVLCIGLLLLIGGLLWEWKIGSFNDEQFFGYEIQRHNSNHQTERTISALLSLPWLIGAIMVLASIKYFYQKRKK